MSYYRERQKALTVQGLKDAVQESLAQYIYPNAIFCAERLYALSPSNESLHILAHCYVTSGDLATAYRLLSFHYPFRAAIKSGFAASSTSGGSRSGDMGNNDASQWDCKYLLGVTCGMTQRYAEGEKVLGELDKLRTSSGVQYWLGICRRRLRRGNAENTFARSAASNPLNFAAYEEYVRTARSPHESMLQLYDHSNPLSDDPVRRSVPSSSSSSSSPTAAVPGGDGGSAHRQVKHEAVRQYLSPFATATFLQWTYRCREARETLQHERFPERDSGWALGALAMAFFHDGDVEKSVQTFARLMEVAPWRLADPALVYYSTALWQRKATGPLGSLSQTLINEMPVSPITLCVVANTYSLVKESKEAICMLNRAVQVDKEFAYAHTLRGYELLYLDRKSEAVEAFHEAIGIDVKHYIAYAGLGELYFRSENIDQARMYFQQAIDINLLPTIMNRYAATYHPQNGTEEGLHEALCIYDSAIKRHPKNFGARHQRAEVLVRMGKLREAYEELLDMTKECSDEPMLYLTLAKCVDLMGMTGQAVKYYHIAMDLDPRRSGYIKSCVEKLAMGEQDHEGGNV